MFRNLAARNVGRVSQCLYESRNGYIVKITVVWDMTPCNSVSQDHESDGRPNDCSGGVVTGERSRMKRGGCSLGLNAVVAFSFVLSFNKL
jgi:hypothetical protein